MKAAFSIEEIGIQNWKDFVRNHPDGVFFHSLEYYQAFQANKYTQSFVTALLSDSNEILALSVSLLRHERNVFISRFTLRAIAYAPPLIKNNDAAILNQLIQEQHQKLSSKAIYIEYRNVDEHYSFQDDFVANNFKKIKHLNITLDLKMSEEDIFMAMSTSARNTIRKAQKEGVKVQQINPESNAQEVYELIKTVYKRIKLPFFTYEVYSNAIKSLFESKHLWVLGAYVDNKLISVMLLTVYKQEAYCWYMGALRNFKKYNATDLLVWETLLYAKSKGLECFNWGGVGYPDVDYGVRNFKKKFGGELIPDNRYIKVYKSIIYRLGRCALNLIRK